MMTLEKAKADLLEANEALIKATKDLKALSKIGGGLDLSIKRNQLNRKKNEAEANFSRALFVFQSLEKWSRKDFKNAQLRKRFRVCDYALQGG